MLKEKLQAREAGGAKWCDQFVDGSSMLGDLAEPGVYPSGSGVTKVLSSGGLSKTAKSRVKLHRKEPDAIAKNLRGAALVQVAEGWPKGPLKFAASGDRLLAGKAR